MRNHEKRRIRHQRFVNSRLDKSLSNDAKCLIASVCEYHIFGQDAEHDGKSPGYFAVLRIHIEWKSFVNFVVGRGKSDRVFIQIQAYERRPTFRRTLI